MLRFLVFAGSNYYPVGGWEDRQGSFNSLAEAIASAKMVAKREFDGWWHVVDIQEGKIVADG